MLIKNKCEHIRFRTQLKNRHATTINKPLKAATNQSHVYF